MRTAPTAATASRKMRPAVAVVLEHVVGGAGGGEHDGIAAAVERARAGDGVVHVRRVLDRAGRTVLGAGGADERGGGADEDHALADAVEGFEHGRVAAALVDAAGDEDELISVNYLCEGEM